MERKETATRERERKRRNEKIGNTVMEKPHIRYGDVVGEWKLRGERL